MKSVPAIAFDYRPSRALLAALIGVAALAPVAIALCGLNLWLKLGLAALALLYAAHSLRAFLRAPFAHLLWHSAGHWRLRDAAERERTADLTGSVVLGALIVLVLRTDARRTYALALLPDNCDAETRRKLRVRLARAGSISGK